MEDQFPLPRGERDVPLMIMDRSFDADGALRDGLPRRVSATLRVRLCEHERSVGKTVGEVVEFPALVVEPVTDLLGSESGQQ